jgi:hypothetical protein
MNFADIKLTYKFLGFNTRKDFPNANDYKVTIKYNGKSFTFPYSMGTALKESDLNQKSVMYSLLMDSYSGEMDFEEFIDSYGYSNENIKEYNKVKKIYNSCTKTKKALERLFSDAELESMREQLQDY